MISGTANKNMKDKVTLSWNTPPAPQAPQAPPAPKQQSSPAPVVIEQKAQAPAPAPEKAPELRPSSTPEPKADNKPATPEPEKEPTPAPKKKGSFGAAFVDFLLVMILLGAIGGGVWYVHQQAEQYRVPTPLELAQKEHLELCKQHEQLQDAAYKADEQLHMRQRIAHLDSQLDALNRQLAEHKQGIEAERGRVLSLQREIIQEDKTSRSVAKNLLIGLPVGNVSTTNGRAYHNAIIHRLESGRITLRTPQGQVRFPVSQLVKDNLPDMARYAFGLDDMVDMSDFEAMPGVSTPKKQRSGKIIAPRKPSTQITEPNYEPESGAPVVDAPTQPATITVEPGLTPEDDGSWQAPQEALPIGE